MVQFQDNNNDLIFDLAKCVGKGYWSGWWKNCQARYRIYKGGRSTKKSITLIGYEILDKILSDPRRNVLVLRDTNASNRTTTFTTLKKIIYEPDMNNPDISFASEFQIREHDMTIIYKPTGQMILFLGMDDPQKIQGIRTPKGWLTDVYFEEAYQIKSEDDFLKVDGSIRGKLPEGIFFQITFLLNAWDEGHWINKKFYEGNLKDDYEYLETHDYQDYYDPNYIGDFGKGLYLHTSTYRINEFRAEYYDELMYHLKMRSPEQYKVLALGMWGNATEAVYPEFSNELKRGISYMNNQEYAAFTIGIDFGISNGEGKIKHGEGVKLNSATTMHLVGLSKDYSKLCFINEYFWSNENVVQPKTGPAIQEELIKKIQEWKELYITNWTLMKGRIVVYVDCADPGGFRQGLELMAKKHHLTNVVFMPSTKMKIQSRVDFERLLMAFGDIEFSEACPNLIRETKNARRGLKGECRQDIDDHCLNSSEYAWYVLKDKLRRWKIFKERD